MGFHKSNWFIYGLLVSTSFAGCSSAPTKEESDKSEAQIAELRKSLTQMGAKVESLESRLSSLNDKVDSKVDTSRQTMDSSRLKAIGATGHPASDAGVDVEASQSASDPESGFVNDAAVGTFRKAYIVFQSAKYPEAVLAFSRFLELYPDHAFAGAAQFYVGESYFKQKEYKLAANEFQRVLTSYDRSSHVSETLKELAKVQELLKQPEEASKNRQLLTSLFPQSPAALGDYTSTASEASPASTPASAPSSVDGANSFSAKEELSPAPAPVPMAPAKIEMKPAKTAAHSADGNSPTGVDEVPPPTAPMNESEHSGE